MDLVHVYFKAYSTRPESSTNLQNVHASRYFENHATLDDDNNNDNNNTNNNNNNNDNNDNGDNTNIDNNDISTAITTTTTNDNTYFHEYGKHFESVLNISNTNRSFSSIHVTLTFINIYDI